MCVSTIFPKLAYSFSRKISACFGVSVGTLTRWTSSFFGADSVIMFVSAAKMELAESGLVVFTYCLIPHFTKLFWIYNTGEQFCFKLIIESGLCILDLGVWIMDSGVFGNYCIRMLTVSSLQLGVWNCTGKTTQENTKQEIILREKYCEKERHGESDVTTLCYMY